MIALKKIFKPFKNRAESLYQTVFPKKHPIYPKLSYSQEGEDMILSRMLGIRDNGFYIDVGAFHPQIYSNTYYFYLQGWKGINIDARPGSMGIFKKIRPNDINLEVPISDRKQVLTYHSFDKPELNGFSKELSKGRDGLKIGDWEAKLISEIKLQTSTLSEVLDEHLSCYQNIDFLNVDVEGLDYQVLKSNNWEKYRPKLVSVEDLEMSLTTQDTESKITSFMYKQGYQFYSKAVNTLIFKREDFQISS